MNFTKKPPVTDIILLCRHCFLFFLMANSIKICTCVPVSWFSIFYSLLSWNRNPRKSLFFYDFLLPNLFSFSFLASMIWTISPTAARVSISMTLTDDILFLNLCAKCGPARLVYPLILFSLLVPVTQTCRTFFPKCLYLFKHFIFLVRNYVDHSPSKPLQFFFVSFLLVRLSEWHSAAQYVKLLSALTRNGSC